MNRTEMLKGLQEENREWERFLDQIDPADMEKPGVCGHWSIKDIISHLTGWRRRTVARLVAARHGETNTVPPWPAHLQTDDEINAWIYEKDRSLSLRQVLDESQQVFQQLLAAFEALPDAVYADPERYLPWMEGQPLTAGEFFAHFHEEHKPQIRAWLEQAGIQ